MASKNARTPRSDSSAARKNAASFNPASSARGLVDTINRNRGKLASLRRGYRRERRAAIVEAVELGLKLRIAPKPQWTLFTQLDIWEKNPKARPKEVEQEEAVRFVMRLYENENHRAAKVASEVFLAVEHLRGEGLDDKTVCERIGACKSIRSIMDQKDANLRPPVESKKSATKLPKSGVAKPLATRANTSKTATADWKMSVTFAKDVDHFFAQPENTILKITCTLGNGGQELRVKSWKPK